MRFFLSGEVDALVSDLFRQVRNRVEDRLNAFFADRDYGPALKQIAIIPVILSGKWRDAFPERRLFQRKQAKADYRLWIDFDRMRAGPDEVRGRLLLRNIVDAVTDLSRKAGKGFDGERFIADLLTLFGITPSELYSSDPVPVVAVQPVSASGGKGRRSSRTRPRRGQS